MNLSNFKDKWLIFVSQMNRLGIPIPTVRDPQTGRGSITAALVVFSSGIFGFCILFMLATGIAKLAGFFLLTDSSIIQIKTAADYSFQFLLASLGGYLGRHLQKGEPPVPTQKIPTPLPRIDDPDQQ